MNIFYFDNDPKKCVIQYNKNKHKTFDTLKKVINHFPDKIKKERNSKMDINRKYYGIVINRQFDYGFTIGFDPIWIHKHERDNCLHYHCLINLFFWYIEIRIGKEYESMVR